MTEKAQREVLLVAHTGVHENLGLAAEAASRLQKAASTYE